jgi:hypothetical protein
MIVVVVLLQSYALCMAQIVIGKPQQAVVEQIVSLPEPYDSVRLWRETDDVRELKKYIGLQVYLPPYDKDSIPLNKNEDETILNKISNRYYTIVDFIYGAKLQTDKYKVFRGFLSPYDYARKGEKWAPPLYGYPINLSVSSDIPSYIKKQNSSRPFFILSNRKDTVYCSQDVLLRYFILVPYYNLKFPTPR